VLNFAIETVDIPLDGGSEFLGISSVRDAAEDGGDYCSAHHPDDYAYQQPGHGHFLALMSEKSP
jgi:hypothetical protein